MPTSLKVWEPAEVHIRSWLEPADEQMASDRPNPTVRDGEDGDVCDDRAGDMQNGRTGDVRGDGDGEVRDGSASEFPGSSCTAWDNSACEGTPLCPPRCPRFFDRTGRPIVVRPLRADDRDRLVAMYEAVESATLGVPPERRETRERWLDDLRERGWNLVARDGDRAVGHIGVAPADATAPEFVVFVHDAYHGRGIGTELVEQAVAHAADRDHEALTLLVEAGNRRAISVFTNVGFEVVERTVDPRMRLPLDDPVAEAVQLPPADRPSTE